MVPLPDSQKIIDKTISDYNLIADKFSSTRLNITTDLQDLADHIPHDAKVLDYGCGNGRMAALFEPENYLGVDPSTELIRIAKELHQNHKFRLTKAGEKAKEKFDAILCLAVIHHLPDRKTQLELLHNLKSSLKPAGILILTAWNIVRDPSEYGTIINKPFKLENLNISRQIYAFSLDELTSLVQSAGFNISISRIQPRNRGAYSNIEIVAQQK